MQTDLDDLPVGGGGQKNAPPDEFASSSNQAVDNSGPLEQRIVSKNWLVRANAFEELTTQFKSADNQYSQEFRDHAGSWKKYLADANPGSLEKCLEALDVFINRADPKLVSSCQNDIIKILIEKCVGHAKANIKTKSLECFNLLFEVSEVFDESTDTIAESLGSKNIKISTYALITLNSWVSNYGVKKVKIKPFLQQVENLAGQSNPQARSEAMNFYKECYIFLGEGLKPLISSLKKQQLDDLEKEFAQLKDRPKQQLRLTRTEKEKLKDAALDDIIKKEEEESKGADTFDLFDAVDLLTKYGSSEWQDKLSEAKAWKEKKDLLDELYNDSNVPKIKPGDFIGIAKLLKKMMGDSNIVVSQTSVKVCTNLAKGLRQDFEPSCKELLPTLIAKFREKKTQVIEDTNNVLNSFLMCTNLEVIKDDLIAGLSDKAPSVKKYVCLYIERASQETYIDVLQRISNELLSALIKASDDSQSEVRDAALQALGIFKGRLGDSAMSKFLQDLNPQKLAKLNESAQNVKPSKYDRPEKKVVAPEPTKPAPPAKKKPAAQAEKKPATKKQDEVMEDVTAKTQNVFDEQPIGGGNKNKNSFDDQPIGGGKKPPTQFDDQPIGGNKTAQFDEQPIGGGNKGGFDAGAVGDGEDIPIKRGAYNLDNLDDLDAFGGGGGFGNPPPIKKKPPPKAAVKKPVVEEEKKGDDGDVLMNDDTMMSPKKTEAKKPPPKLAAEAKPKATTTTAAKTTSKGPAGPQIQEEDVGAGLSKEEAEAKVQENFPSEIVQKFEEAKWQDKVEGFKGLGEQVIANQFGQDVIEGLVKFVKTKMKDWKESNLNLIKETVAFFMVISQNQEKVSKRAAACMMPFLCDKIGDVKLVNNISETLLHLSEIVTPKYVGLQVIKFVASAKAPNTIKEGCNVLIKMTDEFGVLNMAPKEMIDFGILAVNHTNPQVRTQAMALFAIMYQHAGETIKNFLKDIKESTLKLIEDEFAKVTPFKSGQYQQKRNFRGEAAAAAKDAAPKKGGAGGGGGGGLAALLDDAMPRLDITKLLTPKLMPMFKHADWKVRKQAADQVEEICRGANMRIQPLGLGELMDNIKQRMVDPNKAVLKAYIQLMGVVVEALGPAAKQFQKKILPGMLATLADKQSLVRGDAIACMDKWAEHVGPEVIINNVAPMLTQENPELRTEALKWIIKQKDAIKNTEMKEYIKALVSCLSDKTPAIRNLAEEVCGYVMPFTGYQPFQQSISDLLPAVANTIKPILERIKKNVGPMNVPVENMNGSSGAPQQKPAAQQQQPPQQTQQIQQQIQQAPQNKAPIEQPQLNKAQSTKPQIKAKTQGTQQNDAAQKPPQQNLNQSLQPNSSLNQSMLKKKENQTPVSKQAQQQPQRSESREMVKPKGLSQTITQFKQQEEQIQEGVMVHFGFKEKRAEIDRKSKFQLEDIKGEQVEKLKNSTSQCLGQAFCAKMFSNDFKLHLECIEAFSYLMGQQPESLREILDIIFKWSLVKLQDSGNTKFAVSIFDFYSTLFQHLEESEYVFWDFEAVIIIPQLSEKAGINNNILKDKVKKLLKMIYPLYDVKKCYTLIVQYGLNSKNLRAQSECLDELADYLTRFGVDNCTDKEFKLIAKMADNADKNIRENALKFMGEAYKLLDDNIWRAIGDVTPKVQGLLEQRFKKLKGTTGGGLALGGSLAQSSSQSNFYGQRDQSPKQTKELKTTSNIGLKKSIQQSTEMGKQSATPRGGLQFNKGPQKQDLTKSINQFNQSNKSNEDQKRTVFQDPKKQESMIQDNQSFSNKFGAPKQVQTQRPIEVQQFNQVHRGSEPIQQVTKSSFAGLRQQAPVSKQNQLFYDDEDDDLRIFTSDDHFGTDPELDKAQDEITKHIHQLKYADLSKRVDSLVSLNEMISAIDQNKPVLVRTANDLVSAFTHVLIDIFDKSVEDIPLRFAKYFITIVLKTCSCKEIMKEVSEERIFDLAEQLLTRLLIDNLDKVGDNKEGELILKNLNSSMLRLLENCNHTYIFCVLFDLLRKYKDYGVMPKLPNLIIKCLLKLSKILEKLIEKLDMEKILLAIHEYLVVINHENKTQNDEMGIRIVKTVTNELVKLKRESIWEAYNVIQCHGQADLHIYRWIQIILKSLQTQGTTPSGTQSASSNGEQEIRQLVDELRNPEKFESAILKLQRFLDQNPHIDLNDYLQECSKTFQQFIKTNLEKHRQSQNEVKAMEEYGTQYNLKSTGSTDNASLSQPQDPVELKLSHQSSNNSMPSNRISEYQSKLATMKLRNNQKSGAETATNKQHVQNLAGGSGAQHNLNTSFSAMNSSLSQKWHEINKKSAVTKREGGQNMQQMSSTMGGFTSAAQNFESRIGMGQNATQQPMNQSLGGASQGDQGVGGGATNQDLNERLAVMKAKLQALKKR